MIAIAHFAGLVLTTILAASAAVLLDWLFLRAIFQLMRPAAASHTQKGQLRKAAPTTASTFRSELVHGTREIARHFGPAAVRR